MGMNMGYLNYACIDVGLKNLNLLFLELLIANQHVLLQHVIQMEMRVPYITFQCARFYTHVDSRLLLRMGHIECDILVHSFTDKESVVTMLRITG